MADENISKPPQPDQPLDVEPAADAPPIDETTKESAEPPVVIKSKEEVVKSVDISEPTRRDLSFSFIGKVAVPALFLLAVYVAWASAKYNYASTLASISTTLPELTLLIGAPSVILVLLIGYVFGCFGAFVRVSLELTLNREINPSASEMSYNLISSGLLSGIAALVVQSGFFIKILYPEADVDPQRLGELNFQGVAIISFVVGLFTGETIDLTRRRFNTFLSKKTEKSQGVE
jgi:hypothetical protein